MNKPIQPSTLHEDRICNYSGLLSVEQYQWIKNKEEENYEEWDEDEWMQISHSQ